VKKYLVDVYLPISGKHYDVLLPAGKPIAEVVKLLVRLMEVQSGGDYLGSSDTMLLDAESGVPFSGETTVYDAGIRSASRLILI